MAPTDFSKVAASSSAAGAYAGAEARSVTTLEDEVGRLSQCLHDLSVAETSHISLTHCPSRAGQAGLARALSEQARRLGYVSAHLSLDEAPIDALQELVKLLIDALVVPGQARPSGLLGVLDAFFVRYGARAAEKFLEAATALDAVGDLTAHAEAYLRAEDDAHREVRAFTLWAEGEAPAGRHQTAGVRGQLDAHTAQRVLRDLSRLLVALGHKGLLLVLTGGEHIAERTQRQREKGYTLLRELVDNFDSGEGAIATKIYLVGGDALFSGERSIESLPPLMMRLSLPSAAEPPPPHRTWTSLVREPYEYIHRRVRAQEGAKPKELRSLIRISQGLPPTEAILSMSVGHERIDRTVDKLFHHADSAGSVFQVLSGEYGSGKTHTLLHLAERALVAGHPVFWLNLERLNLDLGNPARHYRRVLENSQVPRRGRPSAADRISVFTRSPKKQKALWEVLEEIAQSDAEEAQAAKKGLSLAASAEDSGARLEAFLLGHDLGDKSGAPGYRQDAYRRLLLVTQILQKLDGVTGPVLLIDEAENLYSSGVSKAARRSALRTLAFYCGGALPGACVVLAMTPDALKEMRQESGALLREQADIGSTLDLEDVVLFKRRLTKLTPDEVPSFSRPMQKALAEKVRKTHRAVRGPVDVEDWDAVVRAAMGDATQPRHLVRRLTDELEARWWAGG